MYLSCLKIKLCCFDILQHISMHSKVSGDMHAWEISKQPTWKHQIEMNGSEQSVHRLACIHINQNENYHIHNLMPIKYNSK